MNIRDYVISHEGIDFQLMLGRWHWLLSGAFTIWLINRFGDLFVVREDASVWWLRLDVGSFEKVAESKDDFCERIDREDKANDWLMIPLVDRLVAAGKTLGIRECYAFVQLPILEGDYVVSNVEIRNLESHYAALGPIHQALKDLPDGTKVTFRIENGDIVCDRG